MLAYDLRYLRYSEHLVKWQSRNPIFTPHFEASCDALRGGMDASQYKDYVLFMLFIKYISDKYGDSDDFAPPVVIPKGSSFKDMVALKNNSVSGCGARNEAAQA